jgi:glycine dehydrogenase subunit 1
MSLLGPEGLRQVAVLSHERTKELKKVLASVAGVTSVFNAPFFHEVVLRVNKPVDGLLKELAKRGIQGGYSLKNAYPELGECFLVCATETKTSADLQVYAKQLAEALEGRKTTCLI